MKVSSFFISFLIISLFTVVITLFYTGLNDSYGSTDINTTSIGSYDSLERMSNLSADMNRSMNNIEQGSAIDLVGGLVTAGFTVVKTTWTSFDIYTETVDSALDNSNLGESTGTWKTVALVLGIMLFVFAIIGLLIGVEV